MKEQDIESVNDTIKGLLKVITTGGGGRGGLPLQRSLLKILIMRLRSSR